MDYKEKYEQALAKAKEQYNYPCMRSCMGILEELFPELKESEDEKIRKRLIDLIYKVYANTSYITCVEHEDMLAWLEKQGQEPRKVSIWKHWKNGIAGNGEDEPIYLIKYGYTYSLSSCLSFECNYILLSDLDKLMLPEKQGEKKSLTIDIKSMVDSYEQRLIKNGGVSNSPLVNMCVVAFQHGIENTLDELHLKQGEQKASYTTIVETGNGGINALVTRELPIEMKSAEESLGIDSETYNKIIDECIFGEQKPAELAKGEDYGIDGLWHAQRILEKTFGKVDGYQTDDGILSHECAISVVKELYEKKPAWSEEDERMLHTIIADFKGFIRDNTSTLESHFNECIDWLKSIKQRYT